jgi:hypothetical protein
MAPGPRRRWADSQRSARERHWPRLERQLNGFQPNFADSFRQLQYDLALSYSTTGRFPDIFLGLEQPPVLSIASWALDDLGVPPGAARDELEGRLLIISVLLCAREHLVMALLDNESFAAGDELALAVHLSERVSAELTALSDPAWLDGEDDPDTRRQPGSDDGADPYVVPRWERPMRLIAAATQAGAGTPSGRPGIGRMIELMASGFEVRHQLTTLHADLLRGRPTVPIVTIARAAGIPLRPWPRAEAVLGAMVLTGSLRTILEASRDRLDAARSVAEELGLRTFADFLGDAASDVENRMGKAPAPAAEEVTRPAPLIHLSEPTAPKAIAMARGFLVSDLTLRESWESHREGMFGADEVASRYPAGLILEILAAHGHPVSGSIDGFLEFTEANGFRYYDHALSGIDTDTIGVYLRLLRHAGTADPHRAAARDVLACLERHVKRCGTVPVWLRDCDEAARVPAIDLGEDCGTVAAHLLLGLFALDDRRHDPMVEIGARSLLNRIVDVGLGANVNYPPGFALAAFSRLSACAAKRAGLAKEAAAAVSVLRSELERQCRFSARTAQDAALVTIACFDAGSPELLDRRWQATILRQQRFDGSWSAEPFFAAPNRGHAVTWYASITMTTALAYDALERWNGPDP